MNTRTRENSEDLPISESLWEKGYKDINVSTMGGASHEIVELSSFLPLGAKVLDLACGEGRNSLYCASQNWEVTAVDSSESAINKLKSIAKKAKVNINAIQTDVLNFNIVDEYDLIMSHGLLHAFERNNWQKLLTKIKQQTKPGGFNVFTIFVFDEEQDPHPNAFNADGYPHSFCPRELEEFYHEWEIIRYDIYVKWDQHPGIPLHYHPIEKLVARKPGNNNKQIFIEKIPVSSCSMQDSQFNSIVMGMKQELLLALCGEPDVVDTYRIDGLQIGMSKAMVNNYCLILCFYGNTVIYIADKLVCGKARYSSHPVKLRQG